MAGRQRVEEHVAAFNAAVASMDWATFAQRFSEDAVMRFPQLPVPEAVGREAIAAAYLAKPPDDTMTVRGFRSSAEEDHVDFAWSRGGEGTMVLRWQVDAVRLLTGFFDG